MPHKLDVNFDLLFRTSIGFDHLIFLLDQAMQQDWQDTAYPPYNIERFGQHQYCITMAIAGFSEHDLTITHENNMLIIRGKTQKAMETVDYIYKGIANRAFQKFFHLADYVVIQRAHLENGLLEIWFDAQLPKSTKSEKVPLTKKQD